MNEMPWKKQTKAQSISATALLIDELAKVLDAKSKAEKREKEIKAQLLTLGDGEHRGTKCIAAISTCETTRLDTKELRADHPELAERYSKTSSVTTIRIKPLV